MLDENIDLQYIAWYTKAENRIKETFSRILGRDKSGSRAAPRESQLDKESAYQRILCSFDQPTAKALLLQGMNFEKRLQAYDHREDCREKDAIARISAMSGATKDVVMFEESKRSHRAHADRRMVIERYEAALAARLAGRGL